MSEAARRRGNGASLVLDSYFLQSKHIPEGKRQSLLLPAKHLNCVSQSSLLKAIKILPVLSSGQVSVEST